MESAIKIFRCLHFTTKSFRCLLCFNSHPLQASGKKVSHIPWINNVFSHKNSRPRWMNMNLFSLTFAYNTHFPHAYFPVSAIYQLHLADCHLYTRRFMYIAVRLFRLFVSLLSAGFPAFSCGWPLLSFHWWKWYLQNKASSFSWGPTQP